MCRMVDLTASFRSSVIWASLMHIYSTSNIPVLTSPLCWAWVAEWENPSSCHHVSMAWISDKRRHKAVFWTEQDGRMLYSLINTRWPTGIDAPPSGVLAWHLYLYLYLLSLIMNITDSFNETDNWAKWKIGNTCLNERCYVYLQNRKLVYYDKTGIVTTYKVKMGNNSYAGAVDIRHDKMSAYISVQTDEHVS